MPRNWPEDVNWSLSSEARSHVFESDTTAPTNQVGYGIRKWRRVMRAVEMNFLSSSMENIQTKQNRRWIELQRSGFNKYVANAQTT